MAENTAVYTGTGRRKEAVARAVERKKPGLKKARKRPQFSKR